MKTFRVLVIDDKKAVLDSIRDRIVYHHKILNESYNVELSLLNIEVTRNNGNNIISEKTYRELFDFCIKPFDLLLLDFGYVEKGLNTIYEINELKKTNPEKSIRNIIDEVILNPSDIVKQSLNFRKYHDRIKDNFIKFKGNLYIYTFIPNTLEQDFTSADVRKNITTQHFKNANIKIIDSRKELFNNNQFDNKYDKEYYSFIISKFLSKIIKDEIYECVINETESIRKKFNQYKTNNILKVVTLLILSVLTGVFTPVLIDSIQKGNIKSILIFTIALVLIVVFLTYMIFALEKKNTKVIKS